MHLHYQEHRVVLSINNNHKFKGNILTSNALQVWQSPLDTAIIHEVEQRVIRQLLQALLFEDILSNVCVVERSSLEQGLVQFSITCPNDVVYKAIGRVHFSFGMIRLSDTPVTKTYQGMQTTAHLDDVINDVLMPLDEATLKDSFIKELRQTFIHDCQSRHHRQQHIKQLHEMTYDELEGYLDFGHPYHPCYKSRLGFSLEDNDRFGPEFARPIQLVWLAVNTELLVTNTTQEFGYASWCRQYLGDEIYEQLCERLSQYELAVEHFAFVPVHPWQWQATLIEALTPLMQTHQVVYLGEVGMEYYAQQSIRTLVYHPTDNKKHALSPSPYLKLAMHLVNTSSTRILAKHTVLNSATITHWLKTLVANDKQAVDLQVNFLGEVMGVSLNHERLQQQGYHHPAIYGGLASIWRENVHQYLGQGQSAFPLNGISYIQPNGKPLIDSWLQRYDTADWVEQLIDVTVTPIIYMLFAQGIALECHAQNIVLVHDDGYPIKVLLKDLHDGIRFCPDKLTHPNTKPILEQLPQAHARLNRGSFIETDDTAGIRDMTVACLFFVAFADIAIFLQTHYHYSEAVFWQQVADSIYAFAQRYPEHQSRYQCFDLFAEKTRIESLAKRRLFGDRDFPIKWLDNPLSQFKLKQG